jgi:cytochrome c biogenesis protein CcmG/thiol:disulfide interchange protein DsbE
MSKTLALVAVFIAGVLTAGPRAAAPGPAPDVALQTLEGASVRLADFKGKVVVVDFWASWCPPCKTSFPELDKLSRDYKAKGVEVLAVNLDERRKDADAFLGAHPHTMAVLFDPKGASPLAFGVKGMPSSFVLDREGNIRFTHLGYSGDVGAIYRGEIQQLLGEHR